MGYKVIFLQEARGHAGGICILSSRTYLISTLIENDKQIIMFSITKGNTY